jgi:hypothetical protein
LIVDDSDIILAAKRGNTFIESGFDVDEDYDDEGANRAFDERTH